MPDREKVMKGLECCMKTIGDNDGCPVKCPYYEECLGSIRNIFKPMMHDALSLLKEQEPVEPVEMIDDFYPVGDPLRTIGWRCGKCGDMIAGYANFCPNCGRAVKWE